MLECHVHKMFHDTIERHDVLSALAFGHVEMIEHLHVFLDIVFGHERPFCQIGEN